LQHKARNRRPHQTRRALYHRLRFGTGAQIDTHGILNNSGSHSHIPKISDAIIVRHFYAQNKTGSMNVEPVFTVSGEG
jgi:hypothetical protein